LIQKRKELGFLKDQPLTTDRELREGGGGGDAIWVKMHGLCTLLI